MLSVLFMRKRKQSLEDLVLSVQAGDSETLEKLLQDYQPFVKKTVSTVCKRYIDESDDEFSIGLIAFHDSILKYDQTKGSSLLSFAEVIIKRRVIDYIRSNAKHQAASLDQNLYENEEEPDKRTLEDTLSFDQYERQLELERRKDEIEAYKTVIARYGLTLDGLVEQSPKHEDARVNAMNVARIVAGDASLFTYLQRKKRLPMKELEKRAEVSRKTIERNRKYIIAIILILTGDFQFLQEYIKGRLD